MSLILFGRKAIPHPGLPPETREAMGEAAKRIVRAANYTNAGTVEFLVDMHGNFYFIEVNTRIQVEHPVSEMVSGIDLIKEMVRVSSGEPLGYTQDDIKFSGQLSGGDGDVVHPPQHRVAGVEEDGHLLAFDVVGLRASELSRFDAVLLDPPRAGAKSQIAEIAKSDLPRMVYVSCNPSSWARDAAALAKAGFSLLKLRPVGQFRWSTHVELVSLFER